MSLLARVALLFLLTLGFVRLTAAQSEDIAALRLKAERGNALAQYNLGLAYAQGRLVPGDPAEAFAWLTLASESGATGKALDSLLGNISDKQLSEGRRRLGIYRTALANRTASPGPGRNGTPKLAPRGFSLDPIPPPPAPAPEQPPATTPATKVPDAAAKTPDGVAKVPDAVSAPVTTTPVEGSEVGELAQARKELEKIRADLVAANTEIATLRATVTRLESEAAPTKTAETHPAIESTTAQATPVAPPPTAPTDKTKAEEPPHHP